MRALIAFVFGILMSFHAQAVEAPVCFAAPFGTGTASTRIETPGFVGYFWHCPKESLARMLGGRIAARTDYAMKWPVSAANAPWPVLLQSAWDANVGMSCAAADSDPAAELHGICQALQAAQFADPDRPKVRQWTVQPYGALPDRAMYSSEDGPNPPALLWREVKDRAPVGTSCACDAVLVMKGSLSMCPVDPVVNAFAPCVQGR